MEFQKASLHQPLDLNLTETSPAPKSGQESVETPSPLRRGLSNFFAILGAVTFGIGNYLIADVSQDFGIKSSFPQAIVLLGLWVLFHFVEFLSFRAQADKPSFFSRQNSPYFKMDPRSKNLTLDWLMVAVPLQRGLIQGGISLAITITFYFASLSGINSGIVATLFTTSVMFTAIIFQVWYGQRMSRLDWLGCLMVIGSVVLIAFGGAQDIAEAEVSPMYLCLALGFSLFTGVLLTLNAINVDYVIKRLGFPIMQMNFDGQAVQGLIYLPFFVYWLVVYPGYFTNDCLVKSNLSNLSVTAAIVFFAYAMKHGKGGTVQAIQNTKVMIQTILAAAIGGTVPNWLELGGMAAGVGGVLTFVL